MMAVRSPGTALSDESFAIFNEKVEAAQLVSTILGAEGKLVNKGIEAASDLFSCLEAFSLLEGPKDMTETTAAQKTLAFMKSYLKIANADADCKCSEALGGLNSVVQVLSDDDQSCLSDVLAKLSESYDAGLKKFIGQCKDELDNSFIDETSVEIAEPFLSLDTFEAIDENLVKTSFDMKLTTKVSSNAVKLEHAIAKAREIAVSCGMCVESLVDLSKFEASYRAAIRWLATGNVLYSLSSKAVRRAVLTNTKPNPKAINALTEAMKVAADHKVELPPGLQAVVTRVTQQPQDAQPAEAVP